MVDEASEDWVQKSNIQDRRRRRTSSIRPAHSLESHVLPRLRKMCQTAAPWSSRPWVLLPLYNAHPVAEEDGVSRSLLAQKERNIQ